MMARAPDAGVAASLSAFSQSVGYLVASVGPLMVGLLHSATGSWNIPVALLLVLCAAELATGVLAGRPLVLPAATPPPAPEPGIRHACRRPDDTTSYSEARTRTLGSVSVPPIRPVQHMRSTP